MKITMNECLIKTAFKKHFLQMFQIIFLLFITSAFTVVVANESLGIDEVMQQHNVNGTVIDTEGEPLPGVTIAIKGTTIGTITDIDGNYSIPNVAPNATLVFSFVGMVPQERTVGNQTNINVTLAYETIALEELAVVGYSTKKRSELSSSITVVSSEEISRSVSTTSMSNLLQGRVPGMQISGTSGAPGSSANMVVQGMGSLQAGASPLTVVDGIIGGNYDPKDIASITILRDAAATGLYGSRAAGGVIVITTKSGRSGDFVISVNSTFGPTSNWDDRVDLYDAPELYDRWSNAMRNLYNIRVAEGHEDFIDKTFEEYRDITIPPSILERTSNYHELLQRPGFLNQHQISMSGGNERTTFYVSGNLNHEKGTTLDMYSITSSFRSNLSHKINDKINTNIRVTANYGKRTPERYGGPRWQAWDNVPMDPAFMEDGVTPTPVMDYTEVPLWYHWRRDNWMLERGESEDIDKNWGAGVMGELSWQLTDWLRFNTSNRVSFSGRDQSQFWSKMTSAGYTPGGFVEWRYDYGIGYITSNTLHLTESFGDHNLYGILGQEYSYDQGRWLLGRGHGMVGNMRALSSAGSPNSVGGNMDETAFMSYFGQLDYNYKSKYFLVGSLRYDASSRFGENNRWGNFYSLGASWALNREDFLMDTPWLDLLRLRLSHGTTGNANIDSYLSMGTYSFTDLSRYNAQPGAWPARLPNPDLTWEVATKTNIGIDISVLRRVSLEFNLYHRINDNLLQSVPLEATTGFSSITRNIGAIRNQGFDMNLITTNIDRPDFKWESNFNLNVNKNKVLELYGGKDIIDGSMIIREGLPLRYYYMAEWKGVDPQTGKPQWTRWEDADGNRLDGIDNEVPAKVTITNTHSQASLLPIGSAYPDFTGGFSNHLQYKNFFLDVLTNFAVGQEIYNSVNWSIHDFGANRVKPTKWQSDITWWEKPGDNAKLPQQIYGDPYNSRATSTLYLEDASYLRIQKVGLGYALPNDMIKFVKNLVVTASVENLAVITGFSFGDSDTSFESPTTEAARYRPTRKFLLNIKFDL